MTCKCRQCRWCRRFFPLKVEENKRGRTPSHAHISSRALSCREGVAEGLHHLHRHHFDIRARHGASMADLLPCQYEVRGLNRSSSKPPKPRRNDLHCLFELTPRILWPIVVTTASREHNFSTLFRNCAGVFPHVFLPIFKIWRSKR